MYLSLKFRCIVKPQRLVYLVALNPASSLVARESHFIPGIGFLAFYGSLLLVITLTLHYNYQRYSLRLWMCSLVFFNIRQTLNSYILLLCKLN